MFNDYFKVITQVNKFEFIQCEHIWLLSKIVIINNKFEIRDQILVEIESIKYSNYE